jgi:pimeloyl-ACP methyl ester carboxylesterase
MRRTSSRFARFIHHSVVVIPILALVLAGVAVLSTEHAGAAELGSAKPTIVLVHGAFAESSSWNNVSTRLLAKGYAVVAAATPLRSVKGDSAYVRDLVRSIKGPVVLVGHSYGGTVISVAASGAGNVKGLVYVAGTAPEVGESTAALSGRFPGGTLGLALAVPVALNDGVKDLYIRQDKFHAQFAADVSAEQSLLMGATQRPITEAALNEPATAAAWASIPSWFVYGSLDKNIPSAAHAFMAQRARAKQAIEIAGASHVVMVTHPDAVVSLIERASADASR